MTWAFIHRKPAVEKSCRVWRTSTRLPTVCASNGRVKSSLFWLMPSSMTSASTIIIHFPTHSPIKINFPWSMNWWQNIQTGRDFSSLSQIHRQQRCKDSKEWQPGVSRPLLTWAPILPRLKSTRTMLSTRFTRIIWRQCFWVTAPGLSCSLGGSSENTRTRASIFTIWILLIQVRWRKIDNHQ